MRGRPNSIYILLPDRQDLEKTIVCTVTNEAGEPLRSSRLVLDQDRTIYSAALSIFSMTLRALDDAGWI